MTQDQLVSWIKELEAKERCHKHDCGICETNEARIYLLQQVLTDLHNFGQRQ